VRKTPSGQIARLNAGSWFSEAFKNERVPLLRNALSETTTLGLTTNVEIKAESSDEAAFVGDLVTRTIARISDRSELIYVSSFWESALIAATCAAPGIDRALVVDEIPENWPDRMAGVGARALHAKADISNFPMMERVVRAGVLLRCYTVNDIFLANRLFRLGISAVFTDDPESLRSQ
jgi:glycerophosphoryl diester phosphodiesterase